MTIERYAAAAAVLLGYAIFCAWIFRRHRRRRLAAEAAADAFAHAPGTAGEPWLIAYASQTGFAESLAWRTAALLREAGIPSRVLPLGAVTAETLAAGGRALFILATTGEGDAPDNALPFTRHVLSAAAALDALSYAILAPGDRTYRHFCAFGHAVDHWLRRHGAHTLFDLVEIDNGDEAALRHWQHELSRLTGRTVSADWSAPAYGRWRLAGRRLLNPGSPGGPAYHLVLEPAPGEEARWQAGDIAEVGPCNPPAEVAAFCAAAGLDPARYAAPLARCRLPRPDGLKGLDPATVISRLPALPHREYSIASISATGRLELLVRQMRGPDGRLGLGSGWLTEYAAEDGWIALRLRENRAFHPPPAAAPLILIGNGTGLAGLRAHLQARAAAGAGPNWLLFGERTAAHDFFHREELEAWAASGVLEHLDLAFSRDQPNRVYVQDRVREQAARLREWAGRGAALYVCGSREGMAEGVDAALREILGVEALEDLAAAGRYRRDIY